MVQIEVPTFQLLMVDGEGDPNTSQEYAQAVEALFSVFSVSYTAKFMVKKGSQGIDYAVMPLEGLWWADDMSAFIANDKSKWKWKWKWTMMIMQPPLVANDVIETAISEVKRKKALPAVRANFGWKCFRKVCALKCFTLGHFRKKGQRSSASMISSTHGQVEMESTTRFT